MFTVFCTAGYSSRKHDPSGGWSNATGTLTELDQPGHFSQSLSFGGWAGPAVDYNVVWLDEDTAIEYAVVNVMRASNEPSRRFHHHIGGPY